MGAKEFDCIVVGGGHAGIEAAYAAARLGVRCALVTISKATIGAMSCNPAIGGLAKGQMAREVDALGGLMGQAADAAGIQFRMLNLSKGAAVQSPRAQADKYRYMRWMVEALEGAENLSIIDGMVTEILVRNGKIEGVVCEDGSSYRARTVVVTTGTFLRGLMHIGREQVPGGRIGERSSDKLSASLRQNGLELGRLKTGTPVRLDAKTVELDRLEVQCGDDRPRGFSFLNDKIDCDQVPCWVTYTNEAIHKLLRDNLDRAPLYTGQIKSVGPRYCPSIEGKIVRFPDKGRHQVFLEPEEREVQTIYCNGISTSVPRDIQEQMVRLLPGTEHAKILRYAYAIEYDYCPPSQLRSSLETKKIEGLFLAGQINGTSGYEEAAGQGIIAGLNAARKISGSKPVVLGRDEAYIGVLIDDLLTKQIDEPYRMFTSRAEFRLALRADNADRRLTLIGREAGLVDDERWRKFEKKAKQIGQLKDYLVQTRRGGVSLWGRLKQPNNGLAEQLSEESFVLENGFGKDVVEAVVIDARYEGYLVKQERLASNMRSLQSKKIPQQLDYGKVEHLRIEAREKLSAFRPETLGQAGRISGVTPADVMVLQIYLKSRSVER